MRKGVSDLWRNYQVGIAANHRYLNALAAAPLKGADADPLSYLAAVVRGEIKPSGLSSLEVNVVVTEILEAARDSARTGRTYRP